MRTLVSGAIALVLVAFSLSGCATSEAGGEPELPQSSQSDIPAASEEESSWDETRREATLPLVPHSVKGVPFTFWAPKDATGDYTEVLKSTSAITDRERFTELGAAQGAEPPQVLTMLSEGSGFGVGVDETSSLPEVGLIAPEGDFTSLSSLTGIAAANYLENGRPYQTLTATAAASGGEAVVWLANDESGEIWSLMSWNRSEGTLQELASSAMMQFTPNAGGAVMDPSPVLSTNGRYALFSVMLPENVLSKGEPGQTFSNLPIPAELEGDLQKAIFRVDLSAPGNVVYMGTNLVAQTDPVSTRGVFSASAELITAPDNDEGEAQSSAQSGQQSERRSVVWMDTDGSEPIFAIEDAETWNVYSMFASEHFLTVSVQGSVPTINAGGEENRVSSSWLLVWNLEESHLQAAIETLGVAAPYTSEDIVVWEELQHTEESGDASMEEPQSETSSTSRRISSSFLWQLANEDEKGLLYYLPTGPAGLGPKVNEDILAVPTGTSRGSAVWTFFQWR